MPRIFPDALSENLAIMTKSNWHGDGHFAFIVNQIPSLLPDGGAQCFPLYLYDEEAQKQASDTPDMFAAPTPAAQRPRRDAITDAGLAHFQEAYPGEAITKEDLFYYVYVLAPLEF